MLFQFHPAQTKKYYKLEAFQWTQARLKLLFPEEGVSYIVDSESVL